MSALSLAALGRSQSRHLFWGGVLALLLIAGVGGWAATAEISGAVISHGQVVVESNVKRVQHPTGGIVGDILARDGDRVRAGDIVLRLDATLTRSNLAIIENQLVELMARRARLEAEREGADVIIFPEPLASRSGEAAVRETLDGETGLFDMRRAVAEGQVAQRRQRIEQLIVEISGLELRADANARELALSAEELETTRRLFDQGLAPSIRVTELKRDRARLDGVGAQFTTEIAASRAQIAEIELSILEVQHQRGTSIGDDLRETISRIDELSERRIAALDQLARIDIRAPQDGVVTNSAVHTLGGVVGAGDVLMEIVPEGDPLSVEIHVDPRDIDQVHIGQKARIRFASFSQRTTPEIDGAISLISADVSRDDRSGVPYYTVRVTLDADQVARLGQVTLVPGMPVETFVETGARMVASYLLKPLSDQLELVFRES